MITEIPRETAKNIIEATLYSAVGTFFIRGISVVGYGVVIARLSLHDYGVVVLALSFLTPAVAMMLFGLERLFVSSVADARGSGSFGFVKGLMHDYFTLVAVAAALLFFSAYIFRGIIAQSYEIYFLKYFWIIAAVILGQVAFNGIQVVLEGFERLRHLALLQSVESFVRNVFVIAFAARLDIGLVLVFYAVGKFAAAGVGLAAGIPVFQELTRAGERREQRALKTLIRRHGKWEIAQKVLDQFTAPFKVWLIKFFVSVEGVAVYDFAQKIYSVIVSALPVKAVIFPIISRTINDRLLAHAIITKAKKYVGLFYVVVYIVALVAVPVIITRYFPQYRGEVAIIAVVLLHLFIEVYKLGQGALLYALEQQRFRFLLFYPSLVVQVVLTIVMTRAWGVAGTIFAWHVEGVIFGFLTNRYLAKRFGMRFGGARELFRFDEYDQWLLRNIRIRLKRFLRIRDADKNE